MTFGIGLNITFAPSRPSALLVFEHCIVELRLPAALLAKSGLSIGCRLHCVGVEKRVGTVRCEGWCRAWCEVSPALLAKSGLIGGRRCPSASCKHMSALDRCVGALLAKSGPFTALLSKSGPASFFAHVIPLHLVSFSTLPENVGIASIDFPECICCTCQHHW